MRDLSLHILDIVQNSIKANSTFIKVHISEKPDDDKLALEIEDNGDGMDSDLLKRADDPFTTSRTTRRVGLGIPMLKESALKCEGEFNIYSEKDIGTKVFAAFSINHIDRLPIGDIGDTMIALITANPDMHFILKLESINGIFILDTAEVKKMLSGEMPEAGEKQEGENQYCVDINEFAVIQWLKEYIDEGIKNIFGGVLNEVDS
ncbi:histidine kinase/DNA gyrase B/HSP90-like ATPase [Ruminiclostridium sufflavum DSM 19573]|uniref:Histidine kinase/DNA gyrase B/HSP90-like ATPase n=1 Tax=Ruminiclostridium sufflavum DSM 19573 TaxID=1121337 RepID=A0A318Y0M0_9FIRM|nr:ATP-binding protein [Ruminiclostridium sufflavum]PYG84254.1 histidine kinase/DNA gyrase B/HSP90-like ATPase [Ruminiclostridium sufflavum DSM 19573]